MFLISARASLIDLFQSYIWILESVSSSNSALSLIRVSAGFILSLVRNLTIVLCVTPEGTTCSVSVITTDKKQEDSQLCCNVNRHRLPNYQ